MTFLENVFECMHPPITIVETSTKRDFQAVSKLGWRSHLLKLDKHLRGSRYGCDCLINGRQPFPCIYVDSYPKAEQHEPLEGMEPAD